MIQQGDPALFEGRQVRVVKINPNFNGNRTAKIDLNGQIRTVSYASLSKPKTNSYKVVKTPADLLKELAVGNQKLQQSYIDRINEFEKMETISHNRLIEINVLKDVVEDMDRLLNNQNKEG